MKKTRISHTNKSISQIDLVHQKLVTKGEKSILFFQTFFFTKNKLQIHVNSPLKYNNIFWTQKYIKHLIYSKTLGKYMLILKVLHISQKIAYYSFRCWNIKKWRVRTRIWSLMHNGVLIIQDSRGLSFTTISGFCSNGVLINS